MTDDEHAIMMCAEKAGFGGNQRNTLRVKLLLFVKYLREGGLV